MAKDKKSVLVYCDLIHTVEHLPDELAGKLFKHFLAYVNDQDPQTDDVMLKIAFEPIKQQLKRDLKKYNNIVERNRKNGSKGGRPKNPKKPSGLSGNPKKPQKADTDTVNDTDTGSDNGNDKETDIKKVYSSEVHDCFERCLIEFDEHLRPVKEAAKNNWMDTIEKLNRIDNIPFEMIHQITKHIRKDDFWSKNFLSLTKLRKTNGDGVKYVVVFYEKLKSNNHGKHKSTSSQDMRDYIEKKRAESGEAHG